MIEPQVTAVSGRRYLALLIDTALVAVPTAFAAYQASEEFAIVGRDVDGAPLIDPNEFERMEELLDFQLFGQSQILGIDVVRAQEIGDSVRVFGAGSYQWGLVTAALAALIIFYTVPALIQRTIGMLPFGLEIRDIDGQRASTSAHLIRTVVGVIDMLPVVVPGLVGTWVASSSKYQQRIGDRVAKTVVVDRKLAEFYIRSEAEGSVVTLGEEIAAASSDPTEATPDVPSDGPELPDHSPAEEERHEESVPAEARVEKAAPTPEPDRPSAQPATIGTGPSEPPSPRPTDDSGDAPLPPPPVHRKAPSERPRPVDGELPIKEGVPGGAAQLAADAVAAGSASEPVAAEIDDAWEPPRVTPAPVWQPAAFEAARAEAPLSSDDRPLEDVLVGEPTVGELISADPVATEPSGDDRAATAQQATAKKPVWSDKWRAWMYWDPANKRWLRHDTATNTWLPVD